jgi:N-acetylglucosamine kinase-like BadF-type ATPase
MPAVPLVYAVDAGGTRTTVAVTRGDVVVARWTTGSFAIASTGLAHATETLTTVLRTVSDHVGADELAAGCISSSSMPVAGEAPAPYELVAILEKHAPAGRVVLVNDVVPLLWSRELSGVGVVVCSGTGSSVVGRGASGGLVKVGGHEHIVSDQGSAYSMARKALRSAARDADGTGSAPRLRALAEGYFDRSLPALGRWLAELPRPRATVAGFAPLVTQAAADGDDVAAAIVRSAADYLASAAEVACRRLGLSPARIGLAGGVLHGSPYVRELVRRSLVERGLADEEGSNVVVVDGITCAQHYALLETATPSDLDGVSVTAPPRPS